MAGRVRRVGGTTIRSISHIGQFQTIEDDNSDVVPAGEMIRILMEDNGHIAKMIRDAITVCDENQIPPLVTSSKIFWTRQNAANGSFTKCCRDQRILNNLVASTIVERPFFFPSEAHVFLTKLQGRQSNR